ncbi:stAR-related lipid transfer protein 5-like [Octopus vulgaris]|uniref:StAR-related lipid transfer protein 5-like n=1 Tax=Octopus vulgaris TaxID=6645 RepID=A0AA36AMZ6_OCTVU|nr:stAR-related lipid transfer protein 5-like [Octopus vulgaris]
MDENEYRSVAQGVALKLQTYLNDKDGWEVAKKFKDITVYCKKSPEFSGHLYKAEMTVNAPPATVFEYIDPWPDSPRLKWDNRMKGIETLKKFDKDLRVMRTYTSSACIGLISPRDFVDVIYALSALNQSNVLRCLLIEPNKTKLVNLIQPDLGGMVPRGLVEAAMPPSIEGFYINLNGALKDDGKLISSDE